MERDCTFGYRVDSWVYNSFYQSSQEDVDRVISIIVTRGKLSLIDCCLCGGVNHKFAEYNFNLVICLNLSFCYCFGVMWSCFLRGV